MIADPLPAALSLLRDEPNHAADAALLHALPHVAPDVQLAIVDLIVERENPPTIAGVVQLYQTAQADLRTAIARRAGSLSPGIRAALDSNTLEQRQAAIALIVESDAGQLAYLLADALAVNCPHTRKLAADGLHAMADRLATKMESGASAAEAGDSIQHRRFVCEALAAGVQRWERHRQPCVIEAALWMGDGVEPALRKKLREPRTPIVQVITELLGREPSPRLAGAMLRALALQPLRSAAVRAITRCRDTNVTHALFAQAWLLADTRIEKGCRSIRDERWMTHSCHIASMLTEATARGAVRLIAATGGPLHSKIEHMRCLLAYGTEDIRRAVLRSLTVDLSDAATDLIASLAIQCNAPSLTPWAMRETRRRSRSRRSHGARAYSLKARNPSSMKSEPFRIFWESFDGLSTARRSDAVSNLRTSCPDLREHVRSRLDSPDPLGRVRALRIALLADLVETLAGEIRQMARDSSAIVRCKTIAMLELLRSPSDTRLLLEATNDPDPRVQASAIEALDRLDHPARRGVTEPKLRSSHNRVRANAVKSLLRMEIPAAGDGLLDMLDDPSPAHRISAIWVADTLKLQSVRSRIEHLSRTDPNTWVRSRAGDLLKRFQKRETVAACKDYQQIRGGTTGVNR